MSNPLPPRRPVTDAVVAPHRLAMGLVPLSQNECWLELDEDLELDLREKRRLLSECREQVFVELASSRDAQREACELVWDALERWHPALYTRSAGRPPLETAALCVQEDLCVMEERGGSWCLTAGSVCFPTRWDLPSQLGRPMTEIHERVPGYRTQLDRSANHFFDGMKPHRVFRRGNWSLMDSPALFQPSGKHRTGVDASIDADNAGRKVWLRIEHQTLQRMPRTGAILFGIRIHRTRLDRAAAEPGCAETLLESIRTMAPEMQLYKSLAVLRDATEAYLQRRCA